MKVTPRIPVHSPYSQSADYVEMRYVRFGEQSKMMAIVFGLLEEAVLPQGKLVKKKLTDKAKTCTKKTKRVLSFVLDAKIAVENRLAIWNFEPFGNEVISALQEVVGTQGLANDYFLAQIMQEFGFITIKRREEFKLDRKIVRNVYWDESDMGTVLLYRKRTMDSYIVIRECRHIHNKFELFGRMKKMMSVPMRKEDCLRVQLNCGVTGCPVNLTQTVSQLVEKMKNPLGTKDPGDIFSCIIDTNQYFHKLYSLTRGFASSCQYCEREKGLPACSNGCLICIRCAALACHTEFHLRCPYCGDRVKKDHFNEILKHARTFIGLQQISESIVCDGCRIEKPKMEFDYGLKATHPCVLCTDCLSNQKGEANVCFACGEVLTTEVKFIDWRTEERKEIGPAETKVRSVLCTNCSNYKAMEYFKRQLNSIHKCLICDFCLREGIPRNCKICEKEYSDYERRGLQNPSCSLNPITVACPKCFNVKAYDKFQCASQLSHWWKCTPCDSCFESDLKISMPENCLQCTKPYLPADKEYLKMRKSLMLENQAKAGIMSPYSPGPMNSPRQASAQTGALASPMLCVICQYTLIHSKFSIYYSLEHRCAVCDDCHDIFVGEMLGQKCPKCRENLPPGSSNLIQQTSLHIKNAAGQKSVRCETCWQIKIAAGMKKKAKLRHSCIVCDSCLSNSMDISRCPCCKGEYDFRDLSFLRLALPKKVAGQHSVDSCFMCRNTFTPSRVKCLNKCVCGLCLLKEFLVSRSENCPHCKSRCDGFDFCRFQCANCMRELNCNFSSSESKRVSAMCSNFHTLCCYCVDVTRDTPCCRRCYADARLREKTKREILAQQIEFQLGCFCGELRYNIVKLECGCEVHQQCKDAIFVCRICKRRVRDRPEAKTIRDFLS